MPPAAPNLAPQHDPTIYPVEDDMGENSLETFVRIVLVPLMERYLVSKGTPFFVGSNQFLYWEQFNPKRCVAPDVYVIPGLPQGAEFGCIKVWESGLVPTFALEIVSEDKGKDYDRSPVRYESLGVKELVIFDPKFHERRNGLRWQVYRRVPRRDWLRVESTNEDRVRSKVLGCWLRKVTISGSQRLRLAVGPAGEELFPTEAEAERAAKETERAAKETERAAKEIERAARKVLEAEVKQLRAQLERMGNKR